jgi:putative ABC transport system substrate-binding protein
MKIGRLSPNSAAADIPFLAGLKDGLRKLGWIEGQNVAFETRNANGNFDRLPQLAEELVAAKVDLIVAGSSPGALAAKRATTSVPIVVVTTGDPVDGGVVSNLARPGGNLTGVTALGQELAAKRLEVLKEVVPQARRIAVLTNPNSPYAKQFGGLARDAASALQVALQIVEARNLQELDSAFRTMDRADAVLVLQDIMFLTERRKVIQLAAEYRLPTMYWDREFVSSGGLMFYGAGLLSLYRHSAIYIDKIFKGANPGTLPFEQPTRFELVLNQTTARSLGIAFPSTILARADDVLD